VNRVRVAIVGAGLMGRWHAYYAARVGAEIVAVVDVNKAQAATLARSHRRAAVFTKLQPCLSRGGVDVVHVCTPLETHQEIVGLTIAAGKHVLVEKPLAPTEDETQALLHAADQASVSIAPVHQFPFQRGFRKALRRLDRIGRLTHVAFHACTAGAEGRQGPERREVLCEILPHPLSLGYAVFGDRMDDCQWSVPPQCGDDALQLDGGVGPTRISVRIDLVSRPTRNELTLLGTGGTLHVDLFHGYSFGEPGTTSRHDKLMRPFRHGGRMLAAAGVNLLSRAWRREPAYPGLKELIRAFHQAVVRGQPSPITAGEIVACARLMDRVRRETTLAAAPD